MQKRLQLVMSSRGGGTAGVVRLEKCVLERVKGASWWLYVHDCIYRSDTNNSRCCIRQPEWFGSSYSELIFANIPEEYIFNWSDWISLKKYPVWQQMLFSSVCPQLVYFQPKLVVKSFIVFWCRAGLSGISIFPTAGFTGGWLLYSEQFYSSSTYY